MLKILKFYEILYKKQNYVCGFGWFCLNYKYDQLLYFYLKVAILRDVYKTFHVIVDFFVQFCINDLERNKDKKIFYYFG